MRYPHISAQTWNFKNRLDGPKWTLRVTTHAQLQVGFGVFFFGGEGGNIF